MRKYLYKYVQICHREKKTKQNKTIILLIIKTMNNYDNKNDKIRWQYRYRIEKLMAKS